MSRRIIVIGGVAAGAKAAAKARRVDPEAEILLFQESADISYSACGIPYVIGGVIKARGCLVIRSPQQFAEHLYDRLLSIGQTNLYPNNRIFFKYVMLFLLP